jgi:hypothetical protein
LVTNTHQADIRKLNEQLTSFVQANNFSSLPLTQLADFINCSRRFRFAHNQLANQFSERVREAALDKTHDIFDRMQFFNLANLLHAYSNYDTALSVLVQILAKRFDNLDEGISPTKTVTILHELISKGDTPTNKYLPLVRAAANYLAKPEVLSSLEPILSAKAFQVFSKVSAENYFRHSILDALVKHLHANINQLQEQSVILCLSGLNHLTKASPKPVESVIKFAKDLNSLVVDMSVANADLVDVYFLTRYIAKVAESDRIKTIISQENLSKILKLFENKIKELTVQKSLIAYRTDEDLLHILNRFTDLPGYTELMVDRFCERTKRLTMISQVDFFLKLRKAIYNDKKNVDRNNEILFVKLE